MVEVTRAHMDPSLIQGDTIVVAGGGLSGCDCALELAMEGKHVTIVEMLDALCPNAILDNRNPLMFRLEEYGVKQLTSTRIVAFQENSVVAEGPDGRQELPADTMIAAFGTKPNNAGVDAVCDKYPTTAVVGDCTGVDQVAKAVRGGFFAAWSLH